MHRFFADPSAWDGEIIVLTGSDAAHISRVLRLKENDKITVCDKRGTDYICSVVSSSSTEIRAKILEFHCSDAEPPINITLFQGVAKGDKIDSVVRKCVELGAVKIVPVVMKRSVVSVKDPEKKRERWQKIAYEAAKQCGRAVIPEVRLPVNFADAADLAQNGFDLKIAAYEEEKQTSLKEVLKENRGAKNICIWIGPEGGFDADEISVLKAGGFFAVTLGPRILRTETAPVAAVSVVLYELGDW